MNSNDDPMQRFVEIIKESPLRQVTVIAYGTDVTIGGGVKGVITAVCMRGTRITYEVTWWDGATRRAEWMDAIEVNTESTSRQKIGFIEAQQALRS
jgi:hypothetical protein